MKCGFVRRLNVTPETLWKPYQNLDSYHSLPLQLLVSLNFMTRLLFFTVHSTKTKILYILYYPNRFSLKHYRRENCPPYTAPFPFHLLNFLTECYVIFGNNILAFAFTVIIIWSILIPRVNHIFLKVNPTMYYYT